MDREPVKRREEQSDMIMLFWIGKGANLGMVSSYVEDFAVISQDVTKA